MAQDTVDSRVVGISPMTRWEPDGARWHIHLPVTEEVRECATALGAVLGAHRDRLWVVPGERLHCTLAWMSQPATITERLVAGPERGELGQELVDSCASWLSGEPGPRDGVPVTGLGWAPGGPVLRLDRDAGLELHGTAARAMSDVVGDHWVMPQGGFSPHIALAYATTTWPPADVQALDAELRAAAAPLTPPAPLSPQLLVVLQDTFAPDGLDWTREHLIAPAG